MAQEGPGKDWQLGKDGTHGRRQAGKDLNSNYGAMRMTLIFMLVLNKVSHKLH